MTLLEKLRSRILRLLKVPHEPEPPLGAPDSIRVFRAARNFYKLRLFAWGVGQFFALLGIIFWIGVIAVAEREAGAKRGSTAVSQPAAPALGIEETPATPAPGATSSTNEAGASAAKNKKKPRPSNDPIKEFVAMTSKMRSTPRAMASTVRLMAMS